MARKINTKHLRDMRLLRMRAGIKSKTMRAVRRSVNGLEQLVNDAMKAKRSKVI